LLAKAGLGAADWLPAAGELLDPKTISHGLNGKSCSILLKRTNISRAPFLTFATRHRTMREPIIFDIPVAANEKGYDVIWPIERTGIVDSAVRTRPRQLCALVARCPVFILFFVK
jgi:hypothetical protein